MENKNNYKFHCTICTTYSMNNISCLTWPRDLLGCSNCGSVVRERGLFLNIKL